MKKFRTEVSWKILGPVIIIFSFVMSIIYYSAEANLIEILAILIGFLVLTCYMIFGIWYEIINDSTLRIKAGFFYKIDVPINAIYCIEKTNSILSAPASSLDRIEVKYNTYDSVIISPKNRNDFINELLKINPDITLKI